MRPWRLTALRRFCADKTGIQKFCADQRGAGTVFSLAILLVSALMGGLAVDVGNAWRYNELLRTTADVAAHAGTVVLARGGTVDEARAAALDALTYNMPEARYGRILARPDSDVRAVHYDQATNRISNEGASNALIVRVARSRDTGNPLPTMLMRLAGHKSWDIASESVVALVTTQACNPANGLFGQGLVLPGPGAHVRADYCLHSQDKVLPDLGSYFEDGAGLSMPDLARCGRNCSDSYDDGVARASFEANFIRRDLASLVTDIATEFSDPRARTAAKAAFFASRPMGSDLSALDEVGVDIRHLTTGSVVELTPMALSRVRMLPEGLIYLVRCKVPGAGGSGGDLLTLTAAGPPPATGETGAEAGTEAGAETEAVATEPEAGSAPPTWVMRNLALITDCAVQIDPGLKLEGAMVLSTHIGGDFAIKAMTGAAIGNPDGRCAAGLRTSLLALGGISVTAGDMTTNVGVVAGGDIQITPRPGTGGVVFGMTGIGMHSGGAISLAVEHDFTACGGEDSYGAGSGYDPFVPQMQVIRHVLPGAPGGTAGRLAQGASDGGLTGS